MKKPITISREALQIALICDRVIGLIERPIRCAQARWARLCHQRRLARCKRLRRTLSARLLAHILR